MSANVRDARTMGLSSPGPLCDNTAPSPYALASQDNTSGRSGVNGLAPVQKLSMFRLLQRQSNSQLSSSTWLASAATDVVVPAQMTDWVENGCNS